MKICNRFRKYFFHILSFLVRAKKNGKFTTCKKTEHGVSDIKADDYGWGYGVDY